MKNRKIRSIVFAAVLILLVILIFALGYISDIHDTSLDKSEDIFTDNRSIFLNCGESLKEYLMNSDSSTLSITKQNYIEYFASCESAPPTELFSKHVHQIFLTKEKNTFEIVFIFQSKAKNIEWGVIYSNAEIKTGQPIRKLAEYWYAYRIAYT